MVETMNWFHSARYSSHEASYLFSPRVLPSGSALVPVMTVDRLLLAIGFTVYVYAGSYAKDRRLLRLVGDEYRRYMAEVPGFPLIGFGVLLMIAAVTAPLRYGITAKKRKSDRRK